MDKTKEKYLDKEGLTSMWGKIRSAMGGKVDKINGKTLSTNDFTNEYKTQVEQAHMATATTISDTQIDSMF